MRRGFFFFFSSFFCISNLYINGYMVYRILCDRESCAPPIRTKDIYFDLACAQRDSF
jgi:hypothetical protein